MECKAQTAAIVGYCEDLQRSSPPDSADERGAKAVPGLLSPAQMVAALQRDLKNDGTGTKARLFCMCRASGIFTVKEVQWR